MSQEDTPGAEEEATGGSSRPRDQKPGKPSKEPRRSEKAVPTGLMGRASRLAAASFRSSVRLAMLGPRTLIGGKTREDLIEELHSSTAQEMVQVLGRLKGASMKVGQLASFVDAGVLPENVRDLYQDALSSLRDAAPPMKPELVRQAFKREFDAQPEDLFETFGEQPAAAASLGQVHLATLEGGREVAVKIQYPGIERAIKSDLAMTASVKPLLPLLAPGLDVDDALEEIRLRVLQECDYLHEAESLDTLADRYDGHPFVWIPRSIPDRSTPRILTMERAHGINFDGLKKLPQGEKDRAGEILFRFYYGSLHRYGFTSADPHPGNYRLMDDGRMAFYDFGLTFEYDPRMTPHALGALVALRDGDVESFFEHGVAMRFITQPDRTDPQRFFDWVRFSLAPIREDRDYTFTREFIAERTAALMDPHSEWWGFIRRLNLPRWSILQYRLELGLFAVLAQLGASGNWHRITMEFYGEDEPSTTLGRAEWDWLGEHPAEAIT